VNYKQALKIFVASPGDVPEEREKARETLLALNKHPIYAKSIVLEPYLWDDPYGGTPMSYPSTPEKSVVCYGERPQQCDLLIGILKHRLGSPLPSKEYGCNSNGEPFTGTEWEIHDAISSDTRTKEVFLFVANESFNLPRRLNASERRERQDQYDKVERFLEGMRREDGSYKRAVNHYDSIEEFADKLRNALENWLATLLEEHGTPSPGERTQQPLRNATDRKREQPDLEATPCLTFALYPENGEIRSRLITPCPTPVSAVLTRKSDLDERIAARDLDILRDTLWGSDSLRRFREIVQNCLQMEVPDNFLDIAMRLRIVAQDLDLALLPWHCISDEDHLLGKAGWVIETIVAEEADKLAVLEIPVENPLILAPSDPELDISAAVHASEVQDTLRALLGGHGQAITWARTREELEFHLKHDPPDLIYCFTLFDATHSLVLGHSEADRHLLRLEEFAELLAQSASKPLLWMNLIRSTGSLPDWQTLLPRCRLLLAHQSHMMQPETATGRLLAWLDRLQEGERNPSALISHDANIDSLVVHSGAPVRLRLPGSDAETSPALYARIRAALLRILLGREAEKNMLYGYTRGAGEGALLAYVAAGDEQTCVHDFPAQIRHRLEQNLDDGIRVVTRFIPASLHDSGSISYKISRLFKQHLMPTGNPLREALEALIRHPPLEGESIVIALPWLLDLETGVSADEVGNWIEEWARIHTEFMATEIPDKSLVLLGACIRVQDKCPLSPDEVLQAANAAVNLAAVEAPPGFKVVKLEKPLGKLSMDDLHHFYVQNQLGPRLLPHDLNARRLAEWIISETKTQGGFSETVNLVYREYKEGYAQFQKHEYLR
jgi:hypothetical protein